MLQFLGKTCLCVRQQNYRALILIRVTVQKIEARIHSNSNVGAPVHVVVHRAELLHDERNVGGQGRNRVRVIVEVNQTDAIFGTPSFEKPEQALACQLVSCDIRDCPGVIHPLGKRPDKALEVNVEFVSPYARIGAHGTRRIHDDQKVAGALIDGINAHHRGLGKY